MKKILTLILSFVLILTVFASCVNKNDISEENIDTDTKVEDVPKEDEAIEDIPENEKEDTVKPDKNEQPPLVPPVNENKKDYTLNEIMDSVISVIPSDEHNMQKMPEELYSDIYGIDKTKFEDVLVYGSMMSVKANEIILIKLKNESDVNLAKSVLEARKAQLYTTWEHYLPDQFELVKKSSISTNGKYVALIVAPYSNEATNKFMSIK